MRAQIANGDGFPIWREDAEILLSIGDGVWSVAVDEEWQMPFCNTEPAVLRVSAIQAISTEAPAVGGNAMAHASFSCKAPSSLSPTS